MKDPLDRALMVWAWVHGGEDPPVVKDRTAARRRNDLNLRMRDRDWEALFAYMFPLPDKVECERDARAFMASVCVRDGLGLRFHPDTPFADYVRDGGGGPLYPDSRGEAEYMQALMDACFDLLHGRVYELAVQLLNEAYLAS